MAGYSKLLHEANNQGETNKTVDAWVKEHNNDKLNYLKPIASIAPPRENESDKQNDVFSFPGYYLFFPPERAGPSFLKHDAKDSAKCRRCISQR